MHTDPSLKAMRSPVGDHLGAQPQGWIATGTELTAVPIGQQHTSAAHGPPTGQSG